jgi:hypothetical protein
MSDTAPVYVKSTYSTQGADCVEVARNLPVIRVRDSKNVTFPTVSASRPAWGAFLSALTDARL